MPLPLLPPPALAFTREAPLLLAAAAVLLVWLWVAYGHRAWVSFRDRPVVMGTTWDALVAAHGLSPDDLRFLKAVRGRNPQGDPARVFVDPALLGAWLAEPSEDGVAARRLLLRLFGPAVARAVEEGEPAVQTGIIRTDAL